MTDEDRTNQDEQQTAPPNDSTGAADTGEKDEEKKFTQSDMNILMGKTRKEARERAHADLLKDTGLEDVELLKTLAKEAKAKKEAEQSEADRLKAQIEREKKQREETEAALLAERQARLMDKRDAALRDLAKEARAPEDVILWAEANAADALGSAVTEDGQIDTKALQAIVEQCKKARPHWFGADSAGTPSNTGGRAASPGKDREKILERLPHRRL